MDSRQEKIRLLSRMNRGRAAAPSFLAALSEALGEPVDGSALLPTSETDMLVETFRSGYQSAIKPDAVSYRRFFQAGERSLVVCLADCIAEKLPGERGLFFTRGWRCAQSLVRIQANTPSHSRGDVGAGRPRDRAVGFDHRRRRGRHV